MPSNSRGMMLFAGLCKWVLAMERYEEVDRKVAPKREALQRADQQYQGLMGELRKKQEALRGVQEELAGLQAELDTVKKEKLELEQTVSIPGRSRVSCPVTVLEVDLIDSGRNYGL